MVFTTKQPPIYFPKGKAFQSPFPPFELPYREDFTVTPDGGLLSVWIQNSDTFLVSSGRLINNPGGTLLSIVDYSLEANYTAGKCDSLTKGGSPVLAQSADVHQGSKAQQFTATAFNDRLYQIFGGGLKNAWYRYHRWAKRNAGTAGRANIATYQAGALPGFGNNMNDPIDDAAYTEKKVGFISVNTNNIFLYPAYELGALGGDTVTSDEGYFYLQTTLDLYAMLPYHRNGRAAVAKVQIDRPVDATLSGLVYWANPFNHLFAVFWKYYYSNYFLVALLKYSNGEYTTLITPQLASYVDDAWLEFRPVDETHVALYYNNIQVGSDQYAPDCYGEQAGILHQGGGNNIKAFSWGVTINASIGWAGSSNTANGTTGYRPLTQDALNHKFKFAEYTCAFVNIAQSGWATFPNLVNFSQLSGTEVILFDQSNDGSDDYPEVEAFVRKCITQGKRLIAIILPAWTDADLNNGQVANPANLIAIQNQRIICANYGVVTIDFLDFCIANVPGIYDLNQLYTDTAHPSPAIGMPILEGMIEPYMVVGGGISIPGAARVYADSADYENDPDIQLGTEYVSKTGTWTISGTNISSSEAGATITYTFTGRKFGIWNAIPSYPTVTIVIDGGAPINNFSLYVNGYDIGTDSIHTVIITVTTSVRIDEFWAI